jgi:hypothetical protein
MEQIQKKADDMFSTVFPAFKCGIPYREPTRLFLPFTYYRHMTHSGIMVYEVIDFPTKTFVTLNPFESMPPHCVLNGIDWINMKYVHKMGEFDVFAESICHDVKLLGIIHVNEDAPKSKA